MADLLIIFPAFLQLLGKFILTLGGCCYLAGILAVIHHILHPVDLGFIYALHLVQVVDAQVSDGIRRVAVQVDQCLKAVLLAAFKQPVDRTLAGASDRVSLAVILEEIVQEVVADNLPASAALIAEGFCDVIEVCFQCIGTVNCFQPCTQARYNIIVQIFFIGDGDNIVGIREEHFIHHNTLIAVCAFQFFHRNRFRAVVQLIHKRLQRIRFSRKKQAILINRVAAKHTAHSVAEQTLDIPLQVGFAHGHIFIFYFRGQLVLQAVNVNKNAIQLFFVGFQLFKTLLALPLPQQVANFQRAACLRQVAVIMLHHASNIGSLPQPLAHVHKGVHLKAPTCFKRVPIFF